MRGLELHVIAEIKDGFEEVWITSETTVIHISIDIASRSVTGFSCRLGPSVVAEMGQSGDDYPSFCIFTESSDHKVGSRLYCKKQGGDWVIES